jgi:hypothetical protein
MWLVQTSSQLTCNGRLGGENDAFGALGVATLGSQQRIRELSTGCLIF